VVNGPFYELPADGDIGTRQNGVGILFDGMAASCWGHTEGCVTSDCACLHLLANVWLLVWVDHMMYLCQGSV